MNIPSLYNFVPLSEKVFHPPWGPPSHDIPFSDGISGTLTVELEAKTPIYIRGNTQKPEDRIEDNFKNLYAAVVERAVELGPKDFPEQFVKWMTFHKEGGSYSIPETSIHGMLRNVLKIAAFGSFRGAADRGFSVRDLNDLRYRHRITKYHKESDGTFVAESKSKAGWLTKDKETNQWSIQPCEVARVEQSDLETFKNLPQKSLRGYEKERPGKPPKQQLYDAKTKYTRWGSDTSILFSSVVPETQFRHKRNGKMALKYRCAKPSKNGTEKGNLVFTTQISVQKHMEFIFYTPKDSRPAPAIPLPKETIKRFRDSHAESDGWAYWEKELKTRAIPVFWLEDKNGGVESLGLAQMFRAPSKNTIYDGIPPAHKEPGLDVADRLFGTIAGGNSLKGRVWFGGLMHDGKTKPLEPIVTILGSPKASFASAYLERPAKGKEGLPPAEDLLPNEANAIANLKSRPSWLADEVRVRGWKRYPVPVDSCTPRHIHDPRGKFNMATALEPLPAKSTFTGTIRFHNLRMFELGALLWALDFGGQTNLRHSIGMGKSLGLGSCTLTLTKADLRWQGRITEESERLFPAQSPDFFAEARKAALEKFESEMAPYWKNSVEMKEFFAMATPPPRNLHSGREQFPDVRKYRDLKDKALEPYSEILSSLSTPTP